MLRYATDWNEYVNCRFEHSEHIPFVFKEDPLRSTSEFIDGLSRSVDCYVEYGILDTETTQLTTCEQNGVSKLTIPESVRRAIAELERCIKESERSINLSQDEESLEVSQELTDFLLGIMGGDSE